MIRKESSELVCAFCGKPATTECQGTVCCAECREKHEAHLKKCASAFKVKA